MPSGCYRIGEFELNVSRFEVRRGDAAVKLERIPMELLILLAERNGDLVTRPEIVERLWGKEIFVDTEHGINTAVRKIRAALGEDAEHARYVLTVPGRGYRLIVDSPGTVDVEAPAADAVPIVPTVRRAGRWPRALAISAAVVAAAAMIRPDWARNALAAATGPRPIRSIAVLPIANFSNDQGQQYYADGITDEIITTLAKNTSLRVTSRSSSMQYKNVARPAPEIARELGVDSILEGSITTAGKRVHVTLQLIRASSDAHLWADSFDVDASSAYPLPPTLAESIARAVGASAHPSAERRVSLEAHDAYLRGRYFWFADDFDDAAQYLERAIQAQPDYAKAWSGLADVYTVRAVAGLAKPGDVMPRAKAAVRKALELEPGLVEAHLTLSGLYLFADWNFDLADEEARRVIAASPEFAEAHHLRSYIMIARNRFDEALAEQRRSTELDPFARPWALGFVLMRLGRLDDAIAEFGVRRQAQPQDKSVRMYGAEAFRLRHLDQASVDELAALYRLSNNEPLALGIEQAFKVGGARAASEFTLRQLENKARTTYVPPLDFARAYARLGDGERALSWLEQACRDRSPRLVYLRTEPDFDFLRGNPRFDAVLRAVGLDAIPAATATP